MPPRRKHDPESSASAASDILEEKLGYSFRDRGLLTLALTHRSHVYEATEHPEAANSRSQRNKPGEDNEQLEFLGDAVLGLVVAELLLERFPDCDEGELTRIRAALVSRQRMATFGAELGLGEHLLLGPSAESTGARRRPALQANAAEAVLAAIYLDATRAEKQASYAAKAKAQQHELRSNPLAPIRALVERLLVEPEMEEIRKALAGATARGALRDAKTLLQERVQATAAGKLRYVDTGQSGPAHDRRFTVEARLETAEGERTLASAEGASKREAQQRAAGMALDSWKNPAADGGDSR